MEILFGLLVILAGVGLALLGPIAFFMLLGTRSRVKALSDRLEASIQAIQTLAAELKVLRGEVPQPPPVAVQAVDAPIVAPVVVETVSDPTLEPALPPPLPQPVAAMQSEVPSPLIPPVAAKESLEQKIANRWILWAGAVALSLAGVFLVKFAIDQGWFGPAARTAIGFLIGCVLMAGGEWLRRQPKQLAVAALRPNYVPPALTAAGVSIAYTAAYAGFELYGLLPPLLAFAVLGVLSMGAVLLALPQGPLVALLGVIGGFATPLLVQSDNPSAWGLYIYLTFLVAAALFIVRYTRAWWLGFITFAGTTIWFVISFVTYGLPQDAEAIGCFLLVLSALSLFVPAPELLVRDAPSWNDALEGRIGAAGTMVWLSLLASSVFVFVLLRMDSYGSTSLVVLALFVGLCFYAGRRAPLFDTLPVAAGLLTVAAIAAWHLPAILPQPVGVHPPQPEVFVQGYNPGPIMAPPLRSFLSLTAGFATLFGLGGFAILWRARRPSVWASVAAGVPVLLLAVAYWRIEDFGVAFNWAGVAAVLAGVNVYAAGRLRNREDDGFTVGVGFFAAAAVAALSLGATMTLRDAWLTVALSLQLPALAWIGMRLGIRALRPLALLVAGVVLVRLIVNPQLLEYHVASTPVLNWILYGYGIPAAAFFTAGRWFRRAADDALVAVLEAGALLFATVLVTLELHQMLTGTIKAPADGMFESGLRVVAWLTMAIGIARFPAWRARPVFVCGQNMLVGAAVLEVLVLHVLRDNPLWTDAPVGTMPLLNGLLLAYGVPAGLIWIFVRLSRWPNGLVQAARVFCLALVFIDVSLEVRHHFQGPVLSGSDVSDGEWYSYSVAWLALAGVLLGMGIRSRSIAFRYGSLAVLVLTVGKVFLFDMAALTGLYRAASFAGLGLCLIAVGYLYQKFVFAAPSRQPP